MELKGFDELAEALDRLKKATASRLARNALNQATTLIARDAKRRAPRESGLLRKSIGKKVKTNRKTGFTFGLVGPRVGHAAVVKIGRGRKAKIAARDPVYYAHLVEFGTVRSRAKPFLRPAWDSHRKEADQIIRRVLGDGIEAEARKK